MITMMFGPPQSGKGTLGRRISRSLGLDYISAGEEIRTRLKQDEGWFLGRYSMSMHDRGEFCPPDIVRALVFELLRATDLNCILDGFPRNLDQLGMMGELGASYTVVYLVVPEEELVRRASGRRICSACGEVFQVGNPYMLPPGDGHCTTCGGEVIRRGDDEPGVVLDRLARYREETEPVLAALRAMADHEVDFVPSGGPDVEAEAGRLVNILRGAWDG